MTLLTFWGYGCGPCRVEAPYLTRLLDKYAARGFAVVAVNAWGDPVEKVRSFVKRGGLKQKMLMDGRSVAKRQYAVLGFPTAYWIDHRGVVIAQEVGFRPESLPIMERRIEELLAAKKN